ACLLASVASPSTSSSQTRPAPSVRTATAPLWRASITCLKSWPFHSVEQPCPKDEVDRDTYRLFDLQRGLPTDAYGLDEAVRPGFAVTRQTRRIPPVFPWFT